MLYEYYISDEINKMKYERKINLNLISNIKDFVEFMSKKCNEKAVVKSDNFVVSALSIMGLFSLNLSNPVTLEINWDDENDKFIEELESFCSEKNI